jgi:hypothetical protein
MESQDQQGKTVVVDISALPPAENRTCAECEDFIPEKMGFQLRERSLCAGCLPCSEDRVASH